ncbi:TetR-like C-terminal domain-containing protein [Bacillus tianshenii]|nr:TetR-like C-terminal domain-containing protein [Bacillus tianshenii]
MRQGINKQTVLETAGQIADTEGFHNVTLASVAKALNIKTPSLYNHVKGLPGLKKDFACYSIRKLKEAMSEAAIGRTSEEALYAIGQAYVGFVRQHPGLYEATLAAPDPLDEEVRTAGNEIVTLLLRVLEPYKLEEKVALHTVRGLRSIVHGFASLELKQGFNMDLDTDETLKHLLETYLAGLKQS